MGCLIYFLTGRLKVYIVHYMTENKCQKKCKLDPLTKVCEGCNRTIEEIIDAGKQARSTQAEDAAEEPTSGDAV